MHLRPLSREEVRSIDRRAAEDFGIPTCVLMENAGRAAAEQLLQAQPFANKVLVLCGPGNNGGDGGVVARHLDLHGRSVRVAWIASKDKITGDAAIQFKILGAAGFNQRVWDGSIPRDELDKLIEEADWIVDGLLGTGLTRPVEGVLRELIKILNASGKPILALDLPSGLDADSGQPLGVAVQATQTVTFVAPKLGFQKPGAVDYTGSVSVAGIGVPQKLLESFSVPR